MRYLDQDYGVVDTGSQKLMAPCYYKLACQSLRLSKPAPEVAESHTHLETRLYSSYILGPLPPGVASDDPSTINIDGVVYGVYKETLVNKTWRLKTTTPPPTTTQSSTLGFSFPTYSSVELSNSTAVGPIASTAGQHLWETVLGVGGIATAAAVAFYMCYHYKRPHTPTQTPVDQYTQNAH